MAKMTLESNTPTLHVLLYEIHRINDALVYSLANNENLTDDDTLIMWDMIGVLSELYRELL